MHKSQQDDAQSIIHVIDDDVDLRDAITELMRSLNYSVKTYPLAVNFLNENKGKALSGCIILDVRMPEMTGIEFHDKFLPKGVKIPIIFISAHGDIPLAIDRVKRGAVDFLVKPLNNQKLVDAVNKALRLDNARIQSELKKNEILLKMGKLTGREKEIMNLLCKGESSKSIARMLDISANTVDVHRAHIFNKMEAKSLSELMLQLFEIETSIEVHN